MVLPSSLPTTTQKRAGAIQRLVAQKGIGVDLPKGVLNSVPECDHVTDNHSNLYHDKAKRRRIGRSTDQLPDAVDLAEFHQTQNRFGSSLFKLQVEQLLQEASVNYIKLSPLESFLKTLKAQIDRLQVIKVNSCELEKRTDLVGSYLLKTVVRPNLNIDIAVEMPLEMFEAKDHLNYRYFNKRSAYVAEMYQQLRDLYPYTRTEEYSDNKKRRKQENNNERKKRKIKNHDTEDRASNVENNQHQIRPYFFLQALQGDIRRPIIVIKCVIPRKDIKALSLESLIPNSMTHKMTSWTLRIFAVPPSNVFPERRLAPFKNCIRFCTTSTTPQVLKEEFEKHEHAEGALPPTPMYNGAILDDMRMVSWFRRMHEVCEKFTGFRGAVQLLKVWGRQQGHCTSWTSHQHNTKYSNTDNQCNDDFASEAKLYYIISPISGFVFSLICAHVCLSNSSVISNANPVELFKLSLAFLSETDFGRNKVIFGKAENIPLSEIERQSKLKLFLDRDQHESLNSPLIKTSPISMSFLTYNILWMLQMSLDELQRQASESLALLTLLEDPFDRLFCNHLHQSVTFLDWDITIVAGDVPNANCISAATSFTESNEQDESRESHATDSPKANNATNRFIDLHVEYPAHFNIAGGLVNVLRRGLTDRIQERGGVCMRFLCPSSWTRYNRTKQKNSHLVSTTEHPLDDPPPYSWTDTSLVPIECPTSMFSLIALILSDEKTIGESGGVGSPLWRLVDRGVPANSSLAKHFKSFWGVSSTRRFQDGSVNESVVWNRPSSILENLGLIRILQDETENFVPPVLSQIVHHIIERHFGHFFDIRDSTISRPQPTGRTPRTKSSRKGKIMINDAPLGIPNRPTVSYITPTGCPSPHPTVHFSELKNLIIGLPDLPLDVKEFRFAEAFGTLRYSDPPLYCPFRGTKQTEHFAYASDMVIDCVIEFGKSGGWPTEIEAIKRMKAAILISIRTSLLSSASIESQIGGLTLSIPSTEKYCKVTDPYLDIIYPPSTLEIHTHVQSYLPRFIYRIRVFHPFEHLAFATALTEAKTDIGAIMGASAHLALCDVRTLWFRPTIATVFHSMSLKFTSFAPTVRILKSWFSAQLFPLDQMTDLIEHLTLHIFISPSPHSRPPTTPHSAFARFLSLLISHDWDKEGLYVNCDLNSSALSPTILTELHQAFERRRSIQSVINSSKSAQVPLLWVTSTLDPHCQLIVLPSWGQSKQLLDVARKSFEEFNRLSSLPLGFNIDSPCAPSSPQIWYLSKSNWSSLFNPTPELRFDIAVTLSPFITSSLKAANPQNNENVAAQKLRKPFKNVKKLISSSKSIASTRQLGEVQIGLKRDSQILKEAGMSLCNSLFNSTVKHETLGIQSVMSNVCRSPIDLLIDHMKSKIDPSLSNTHLISYLLQELFEKFINQLRDHLHSFCDVYYDSLARPYPSVIYIKVNPQSVLPLPLSSFGDGCPKIQFLFQPRTQSHGLSDVDRNDSSDDDCLSAPLSTGHNIAEILNSVLLVATIGARGCSLISSIELL